jgi:hypothetical protein
MRFTGSTFVVTSKQAKLDGTLENGQDPPHPSLDQRKLNLQTALSSNGYALHSLSKTTYANSQFVKFTADVQNGQLRLELEIFYFPNLAWSSGGRRDTEKRIQLSQDWSDHSVEFELSKTGSKRCLLIGTYTRNGQTIFAAWDAASYRNHRSPSSCYVDVDAIATAMRDGFGQSLDAKNRMVCCFRPEFIYYYINNMQELHGRVLVSTLNLQTPPPETGPSVIQTAPLTIVSNPLQGTTPRNRVIYGAPGTGKSYKLEQEAAALFPSAILRTRVTFYPDYTYQHLVGTYRPTPLYRDSSEVLYESDKITHVGDSKLPVIDYRFNAGPMLQMYCTALRNPNHNFLLIIEELNRADAAAAFGDWFQLLDRNKSGESEFQIATSPDVQAYLASQGVLAAWIKLPANLYIWATMNSADQGVMPLDAAFKRRWSFEYVGLEDAAGAVAGENLRLRFANGGAIGWNAFRQVINAKLRGLGIAEDRLLGPFFLKREEMQDSNAFKNKLLMYLREDVVRHDPEQLFNAASFGEIVAMYDAGNNVFRDVTF